MFTCSIRKREKIGCGLYDTEGVTGPNWVAEVVERGNTVRKYRWLAFNPAEAEMWLELWNRFNPGYEVDIPLVVDNG